MSEHFFCEEHSWAITSGSSCKKCQTYIIRNGKQHKENVYQYEKILYGRN